MQGFGSVITGCVMAGKLRRWIKKDDGVVAVEFALIALPFFLMLLGLIEISLYFASGVVLEGSANDAARTVRTGQAQLSSNPENIFKTALCGKIGILIKCNDVQYEVIHITGDQFSSANAAAYQPKYDANGRLIPSGFSTGNSNDVVLIRAYYQYHFLTPFLGAMITGSASKDWSPIMSTVVVKAEPYVFGEN